MSFRKIEYRYIPLVQQKWCCVPACISMIMLKHNIPLLSQEILGNSLGLVIPKKDSYLFNIAKTGQLPQAGYGTQIKGEPQINAVLRKLNIPLQMKYQFFNDYNSLIQYFESKQNKNFDVLASFNYYALYKDGKINGHVSLINDYSIINDEITLIDPEYNVPKYRTVILKDLFKATQKHGEKNMGGFWEFITC